MGAPTLRTRLTRGRYRLLRRGGQDVIVHRGNVDVEWLPLTPEQASEIRATGTLTLRRGGRYLMTAAERAEHEAGDRA